MVFYPNRLNGFHFLFFSNTIPFYSPDLKIWVMPNFPAIFLSIKFKIKLKFIKLQNLVDR
jgi:hypothetical protein